MAEEGLEPRHADHDSRATQHWRTFRGFWTVSWTVLSAVMRENWLAGGARSRPFGDPVGKHDIPYRGPPRHSAREAGFAVDLQSRGDGARCDPALSLG